MQPRILEHILSILIVALAFGVLTTIVTRNERLQQAEHLKSVEPYLHLDSVDLGDPLHRSLFKETLELFFPNRRVENEALLRSIDSIRQIQFTSQVYKTGGEPRGLSGAKLLRLGSMYGKFIAIYLIVILLSYHAGKSLAILRFVREKQHRPSHLGELVQHVRRNAKRDISFYLRTVLLMLKAILVVLAYAVLFAPAYVIAYSIRSGFDTGSSLFMIVLGVISNGSLITYANKFYTFLVTEDRKGYVQTALVKNLDASYAWGTPDGVPYTAVLRPNTLFASHVFRHVYLNARYQYLPSLKEHASFLITGLIIIEMALNIRGHLGYEMLQNILYEQYDVVASIIIGIFLIVKVTEIVVDLWFHHESAKYENKP